MEATKPKLVCEDTWLDRFSDDKKYQNKLINYSLFVLKFFSSLNPAYKFMDEIGQNFIKFYSVACFIEIHLEGWT